MKFCSSLVGLSVVLFLGGCFSPSTEEEGEVVSASTWTGGEWPLPMEHGRLVCDESSFGPATWFKSPAGVYWPLNGVAMTVAKRDGEPYKQELEPIWRLNKALPGFRISLGDMTAP